MRLLYSERQKYLDTMKSFLEELPLEEQMPWTPGEVFDYEGVIVSDPPTAGARADNLKKFLIEVLEKVILKNIDQQKRTAQQHDCPSFFTNETLLMALKANTLLREKALKKLKKEFKGMKAMAEEERMIEEKTDQTNQFTLSLIFEDLCQKLQHVQPYDILRVLDDSKLGGSHGEAYKKETILHVSAEHKRNNFFFLGDALRSLLTGSKVQFSSPSLEGLKNFIESTNVQADGAAGWRQKIMSKLQQHKSKEEIANFNQVLVQRTIEEAMELTNPICTI